MSLCSSSTNILQENIQYNSINTISVARISVYTTKVYIGLANVLHTAQYSRYPNFILKILNSSRVVTIQGRFQYVHLCQFPGISLS